MFGKIGRKIHREENADHPARDGEHFAHDAAHDADNGRECEERDDDPVNFGHMSENVGARGTSGSLSARESDAGKPLMRDSP